MPSEPRPIVTRSYMSVVSAVPQPSSTRPQSAATRKLHVASGLRSVVGCEIVALVEFPRIPVAGTAAVELHTVGFDSSSERQAHALFGTPHGTTLDLASRSIAARTAAGSLIM